METAFTEARFQTGSLLGESRGPTVRFGRISVWISLYNLNKKSGFL